MKKILFLLLLASVAAGCSNGKKVSIKGSFTGKAPKSVYLERNEIDKSVIIDSAKVKNNHFSFKTEITEPEFYQIRIDRNDFITVLAFPGEKINLTLKGTPLISNYSVTGSKDSEHVRDLEVRLYKTKQKLDSLRTIYNSLTEADLSVRGPMLQKEFTDIVNEQRMANIKFILANYKSMAAIKAVYQRIDENAYVLYQPRDLQYLKIVSDSLSTIYPDSKHVKALKENVKGELNQMYLNKLESMATESSTKNINPDLRNINGERVSLQSLRGKYVLLSFWTTTDEASVEENKLLRTLYKLYHNKGLEIYQISLDSDISRWRSYVKFEEIPWISVIEDDPLNPYYARTFAISSLPSNFLIDKTGEMLNANLHDRNLQIKMDQLFNR